MKINEILNEGPLDLLQKAGGAIKGLARGGIGGAVQGYQDVKQQQVATQAAKASTQAANQNIKIELGKWNQYAAQRGASSDMKNPEVFRSELQQWANSRYPSAKNAIDVSKVNPTSASTVSKYITDMYNTAMANRSIGKKAPTQQPSTAQQPASQAPQQSSIYVPPTVGSGPRAKTAEPAADVQQQALAQGVKVISQEPIVISHDNRQYGLDDKGQWIHLKSGKVPAQSLQAFLSQQHDISLGVK